MVNFEKLSGICLGAFHMRFKMQILEIWGFKNKFWLPGGLVEYFEDQLKNFENIEDHFVILRGSEDQNVILQKLRN